MLSAVPIREVMHIAAPMKIELWPMAIVVVKTNMHSCKVELKHAGRLPYGSVSVECNEAPIDATGSRFSKGSGTSCCPVAGRMSGPCFSTSVPEDADECSSGILEETAVRTGKIAEETGRICYSKLLITA